ncbi:MAG: DUF805 domain-containing protein [Ruminococcus sp.]|jgi:uncharacterized membrane protein YhaH (DUF805 family)|nr:DUF805 domain-containing protein [Ruminococcus flavefaciens]MBQ1339994.1 DUF805 domain-containing protein [Ruminococcus sp.]
MKCPYCGAELLNNAKFCEECGAATGNDNYSSSAPQFSQPYGQQQQNSRPQVDPNYVPDPPAFVTFPQAVKMFFKNWNNFSGRSTRSEFWYAYILQMIIGTVAGYIGMGNYTVTLLASGLVSLILFIPFLAASVRRLHDIGKSGWWYLIAFTCIGAFFLLYWYAQPGDPNENMYGPSAEQKNRGL